MITISFKVWSVYDEQFRFGDIVMINEVQAISLVAAAFIVVYFIGSVRNKKLMQKYSRAIKDHMTPYSDRVGFQVFKPSGFRALCEPKKGKAKFSKIEIAVSMMDRENVLHYPLAIMTKDYDRFVCWSFLENAIPTEVEILPKSDKKLFAKLTSQKPLKEFKTDYEKLNDRFILLAADAKSARKILSNPKIQSELIRSGEFLKRLSLDEKESWVHLTGKLTDNSLKPLLDLVICCNEALGSKSTSAR